MLQKIMKFEVRKIKNMQNKKDEVLRKTFLRLTRKKY